jgi:uncharacterized protein (TIGR02646 family)
MKKIRKTNPPPKYSKWLDTQKELGEKDGLVFKYDDGIEREAFDDLKQKLIEEQGYLCAYTGIKIQPDTKNNDGQIIEKGTFHVEHLKSRTTCKKEQKEQKEQKIIISEDLDYRNMVACYPKDENDTSCTFGAIPKKGWWHEEEFVSPCQEDCERRFSFSWNGTVSPTLDNDAPARITIEKLKLNKNQNSNHNNQMGEYHVHDRRRDAIKAFFGFGKNSKPLTKKEAEILLRTIYNTDPNGHLREFCFVLKQLLERHIKAKL